MPKVNKPAKKKNTRTKAAARKPASAGKPTVRAPKPAYSEEYTEYLQRYAMYGTGRPHLNPAEFDQLDDEMLDLLGIQAERGLNDEQIVRLQELEFLLLDSEQ